LELLRSKGGKTPIHFASSEEVVWLLVKAGAKVNDMAIYDRDAMPIHQASRSGNINVVKALLDAKAIIDSKTGVSIAFISL